MASTISKPQYERGAVSGFFHVLYILCNFLALGMIIWIIISWRTLDIRPYTVGFTAEKAQYFEAGATIGFLIDAVLTILVWCVVATPLRWLSRPRKVV